MRQLLVLTVAVLAASGAPTDGQETLQNPAAVTAEAAFAEFVPPGAQIEQVVFGAPGCCGCCQKSCDCTKRARIVCEMKKIKKHTWECECENVCTLLPSKLIGWSGIFGKKGCGCGCGDAAGCCDAAACCDGCADGCCGDGCDRPKLGCCRERVSPVLKVHTVEVPVYKCIVEYNCADCCDAVGSEAGPVARREEKKPEKYTRVALLPRHSDGYAE